MVAVSTIYMSPVTPAVPHVVVVVVAAVAAAVAETVTTVEAVAEAVVVAVYCWVHDTDRWYFATAGVYLWR